jgi:hypothetical protein
MSASDPESDSGYESLDEEVRGPPVDRMRVSRPPPPPAPPLPRPAPPPPPA